jgi:acid phosphatase family membrane protein YuiD
MYDAIGVRRHAGMQAEVRSELVWFIHYVCFVEQSICFVGEI